MNETWWRDAVFYQIYPRSFKDSNGDGIGDLPGIVEKLDYLVTLGVTALWVSPFFASPMEDFGYDISDYCDVDPSFGTLADADALISEAHKRRIKVIFDLVINHTSDAHPWFIEARSSRDNPKHDWYLWQSRTSPDGKRLRRPNNWTCQFELKSAWWDNPETDEWYLATFTRHQPEVNWRNAGLQRAMFDVIRFWLDRGIDGFRMDAVNWYIKDDRLRSNPFSFNAKPDIFQRHLYDRNRPETHDICRKIRSLVDEWPGDRALIGEIFARAPSVAASYQGNGRDELHMAFNMELLFLRWNAKSFAKALDRWYGALPADGWPNLTLSNHDQPRHATRFRARSADVTRARLEIAAMLMLAARGTPFLYYGEELGMKNEKIPRTEIRDPTGKTFWPLPFGRDGERTPMQWTSAVNAGFTEETARPWLRVGSDSKTSNVATAMRDTESLWHWYRALIETRKESAALTSGNFAFISRGERGILAFLRSEGTEMAACYLNFSRRQRCVSLANSARVILGNARRKGSALEPGVVVLAPQEALLIGWRI